MINNNSLLSKYGRTCSIIFVEDKILFSNEKLYENRNFIFFWSSLKEIAVNKIIPIHTIGMVYIHKIAIILKKNKKLEKPIHKENSIWKHTFCFLKPSDKIPIIFSQKLKNTINDEKIIIRLKSILKKSINE